MAIPKKEKAMWEIFAFAVVVFVASILAALVLRQQVRAARQTLAVLRENEAFSANVDEQNRKWQERIAVASHLLTGKRWQDATGKREFIEELYGPEIPQYLWFALGSFEPSVEEIGEITEFFWGESGPHLRDCEFHRSENNHGTIMRIRNPRLVATSVVASGRLCPLFQVGHAENLGDDEYGVISFPRIYAQKEKGAA